MNQDELTAKMLNELQPEMQKAYEAVNAFGLRCLQFGIEAAQVANAAKDKEKSNEPT